MTDQLSLSIWLERSGQANRLKQFEKLLRLFPFSQRPEQGQSTTSVHGVAFTEPPLLESPMNGPLEVNQALESFAGYSGDDLAFVVEGFWDLWQNESGDWKLAPARVQLACYGPDFDNGTERPHGQQEDLRIDFGVDSRYLPNSEPGSARMTESNIKSMLRLVHELDTALPVAKRRLETESGENFAERLQQVLAGSRLA